MTRLKADLNRSWVFRLFLNLPHRQIITYCRCIGEGTEMSLNGDRHFSVYYYASIYLCEHIDIMYLSALEKEYYKWICQLFSKNLKAAMCTPESIAEQLQREEMDSLFQRTKLSFGNDIKRILGIDLEMIIELSGSYYEGIPCRSSLLFRLSKEKLGLDCLELERPIDFSLQNTRLIRKLLQMGQEGQVLFLERNLEKESSDLWQVRGLCQKDSDSTSDGGSRLSCGEITFRILRHMAWEMEIDGKTVVSYRCGQYEIIAKSYYIDKFHRKLYEVFGNNSCSDLEKLFKEARCQTHGTVLIILESPNEKKEKNAATEADRLVRESTGIKIKPDILSEHFIRGATSIDGAMIVDTNGIFVLFFF